MFSSGPGCYSICSPVRARILLLFPGPGSGYGTGVYPVESGSGSGFYQESPDLDPDPGPGPDFIDTLQNATKMTFVSSLKRCRIETPFLESVIRV